MRGLRALALLAAFCVLPAAADVTIAGTVCGGSNALVTFTRLSETGVQLRTWTTWYTGGALSVVMAPNTDAGKYQVQTTCQGAGPVTTYWMVPDIAGSLTPAAVTVDQSVKLGQYFWDTNAGAWKSVTKGISSSGSGYGPGDNASLNSVTVTPSTDGPAGTFRRNSAAQTNPVLGVQTELNVWLGYFDKLGNVNKVGQSDGCASWSGGVLNTTGVPCGSGEGGTGTPGGVSGQVQINNNGSFAGRSIPDFIDDGENIKLDPAAVASLGGYTIATTAPATCAVGSLWFDSDAAAGQNWFGCTNSSPATWTQLGGGGSAHATNFSPGRTSLIWLTTGNQTIAGLTLSSVAGQIRVYRFVPERDIPFTKGLIRRTSAIIASSSFAVAIYAADGSRVFYSGVDATSGTSGGDVAQYNSSGTLTAGADYYLAWGADNTGVQAAGFNFGSFFGDILNRSVNTKKTFFVASETYDATNGLPATLNVAGLTLNTNAGNVPTLALIP